MKKRTKFLFFFLSVTAALFPQQKIVTPGSGNGSVMNGNEAIATSYTLSACGLNYVQASTPIFGRSGNNYTPAIIQPFSLNISGIPACAVIERAFLYVSTTGSNTPFAANITNPASGNSIFTMVQIGTGADKNWGRAASYTYRADVTLVVSGNGSYTLSGIPTSSLVTDDDANGVTLLIIYSDRTQNYTGNIVIADGCVTSSAAQYSTAISGFSVCGTPSLSSSFMIVDDLQQNGPTSFFLNSATPNYTIPAASGQPWNFITDPGAPLTAGQTNAQFGIAAAAADTLGLIVAGLYYQTGCLTCPVQLSLAASSTPSCLATATVNVNGGIAPYAFVWSGSAQTTSVVNGLSAGITTVTVSDQNNCLSGTATVNVVTPAPPITLTGGSVCIGFGVNLAAGAAAGYTWSPAVSINLPNAQNVTASPLANTVYSVDYVTINGCTGTQTTQVTVSYTQNIGVSATTLCAGQALNLSANSFTGAGYIWTGPNAYSYTSAVQGNPPGFVTNTLMSGPYNLSVTSVPGCTSMATTNVTVFPLPATAIASNGTICAGFNLTLNGSGGTTYTWTGPNGFGSNLQNTQVANSTTLASGVYSLVSSFVSGCSQTATLNALVRALPPASCAITSSNVCLGRTINFAASGGVLYQWNGPNGFFSLQQNPTIPAITLAANGVYTVLVTDASGCQANATTTLAALFNPTVNMVCPVTCYGSVATLTANGLGFYTFLGPNGFIDTNPPIPQVGISITTVVATALSAGVYTIELESALNSCTAQATGTLSVIPIPTIVATGSTVCFNAVATLTATGGVANGYTWTGPQAYTSANQYAFVPLVDGLTSGIYTVVGTAPNNCTSSATATLLTLPLPTVVATGSVVCLNEPFTFTASGAVTYTWAGPSAYAANSSTAFVALVDPITAGDYTVTGTAANTCTQLTVANLTFMPLPTITAQPDNVCLNEPALLQSNGGIAGGYRWAGPNSYTSSAQNAIINSAISVAPQIYTVVGTAANSCTNVSTAMLTTIPLPTVVATSSAICYKEPFVIPANGADVYSWTGPSSYTFSGQNAPIAIVNEQSTGIYTVVGLQSATGCTNSAIALITSMPLPNITATSDTVCYLTPAILKAFGGIQTGYTWTGPDAYGSNLPNAYIPSANSHSPQVYTVVGTAPNTCTNITTATLTTFDLPVPTYTAPSRVCFSQNIELKAGGAETYTWTGPYFYYSESRDVWFPTYNMLQAGTYSLSVIDRRGCYNDTTLQVLIDPQPEGYLTSDNANGYCTPYCSQFRFVNTNSSPVVETLWVVGNGTLTSETFNYCAQSPGQKYALGSFTNALGCANTLSLPIIAYPRPEADFYFSPAKPVELIDDVQFHCISKGGDLTEWAWYFKNDNNYIGRGTNTSYIFENANHYEVAMVVTNRFGCSDTAVKSLTVLNDIRLFVPDAFSPNGDGLNDVFQPKGRGISKYLMTIYDRWGRQVFVSDDFFKGWDGSVNGNPVSDDVFTWRIIYTDVHFHVNELSGHVTLVR